MIQSSHDTVNHTLDIAAGSVALASFAAILPPMASLLSIIWLAIRIYESQTIQRLLNKDKAGEENKDE